MNYFIYEIDFKINLILLSNHKIMIILFHWQHYSFLKKVLISDMLQLKGIVHPKMKILSLFTHNVIPNP